MCSGLHRRSYLHFANVMQENYAGLRAAENSPASAASSVELVRRQVDGGGRVAMVSPIHHHHMLSSCSIDGYGPAGTMMRRTPQTCSPMIGVQASQWPWCSAPHELLVRATRSARSFDSDPEQVAYLQQNANDQMKSATCVLDGESRAHHRQYGCLSSNRCHCTSVRS